MGQTQFFKWNLLLSVLFLMSACERPQEQGSGVVRFNLSNLTKASAGVQSAIQVQSVSSATLDDGNNWGLSDPTSMSEIGCYGVMVSAVTDSDNTGQCIYGSGQTFKFKFLAGLVDANASLSIPDIAYGTHTFYVVGMKKGSQACETIVSGGNITQANYSNPLLLGQATTNLNSPTQDVQIPVSVNPLALSEKKIGNCSFGGDKKFTNLSFRGAADYQNSVENLRINSGMCAKFYAVLSNSPYGGGGGINDVDRTFTINYGANTISTGTFASLPQFYSDPTCSSAIADGGTVSIVKGDIGVALYAKGTGTGASAWSIGGANGDRLFTITDSAGVISPVAGKISILKLSTGSQLFNPFVQSISIYPGQCREIEYYWTQFDATTGREWATNVTSGLPMNLKTNSLAPVNPPTSNSGFDNASCANASNPNISSLPTGQAFGSFFMKVGTDWTGAPFLENLKLIVSGQVGRAISVNPVPLAAKLTISAPPVAPFVSDCVVLNVTPVDQLGTPLSIYGYDLNSSIKAIPLMGGLMGPSGGSWVYQSADCSTNQMPFNWNAPVSPGAGATQIPISFRPGFPDVTSTLNISGWPVVRGGSDNNSVSVTAQWDPALLGPMIKRWGRPEKITGSGFGDVTGLSGWPFNVMGSGTGFSGVVGTASVISADTTLKADGSFSSFKLNGATGPENIHTSSLGLNDFLIAALVKVGTGSTTNDVVLEIDENSNLHDVHVGSSNLTLGATTVIGAANLDSWQVVFVNRQGSTWSGTAWSSASKAALTTAADISGTGSLNYLYLGTSQTAHDISGAVAEVLALDATGKTATDISGAQSKIYQYMKARYPAAGL